MCLAIATLGRVTQHTHCCAAGPSAHAATKSLSSCDLKPAAQPRAPPRTRPHGAPAAGRPATRARWPVAAPAAARAARPRTRPAPAPRTAETPRAGAPRSPPGPQPLRPRAPARPRWVKGFGRSVSEAMCGAPAAALLEVAAPQLAAPAGHMRRGPLGTLGARPTQPVTRGIEDRPGSLGAQGWRRRSAAVGLGYACSPGRAPAAAHFFTCSTRCAKPAALRSRAQRLQRKRGPRRSPAPGLPAGSAAPPRPCALPGRLAAGGAQSCTPAQAPAPACVVGYGAMPCACQCRSSALPCRCCAPAADCHHWARRLAVPSCIQRATLARGA